MFQKLRVLFELAGMWKAKVNAVGALTGCVVGLSVNVVFGTLALVPLRSLFAERQVLLGVLLICSTGVNLFFVLGLILGGSVGDLADAFRSVVRPSEPRRDHVSFSSGTPRLGNSTVGVDLT